MKRLLFLAPVVLLMFGGCASTGFLGFLATTQYVDQHIAKAQQETDAKVAQTQDDVNKLQSNVQNLDQLKAQLTGLIADLQKQKEETAQLQDLAKQVEARLNQLPVDTIRQIVLVLQDYVQKYPNGPAPAAGSTTSNSGSTQ